MQRNDKNKSPKKSKKVINIIMTSLQILIVIVAICISSVVIANPNIETNEVSKTPIKILPVLTSSMKGDKKDSFNAGDLLISVTPKDAKKLEVGDVITYLSLINGIERLNTHRIVEIETVEDAIFYQTKGDNNPDADAIPVHSGKVLAVYSFHVKGIGGVILWLQNPDNFLFAVVIPLGLLFIWNLILFIKMFLDAKTARIKAETEAKILAIPALDEEEIKRKAIEEYLLKQQANLSSDATPSKKTSEETPIIIETAKDDTEKVSLEQTIEADTIDKSLPISEVKNIIEQAIEKAKANESESDEVNEDIEMSQEKEYPISLPSIENEILSSNEVEEIGISDEKESIDRVDVFDEVVEVPIETVNIESVIKDEIPEDEIISINEEVEVETPSLLVAEDDAIENVSPLVLDEENKENESIEKDLEVEEKTTEPVEKTPSPTKTITKAAAEVAMKNSNLHPVKKVATKSSVKADTIKTPKASTKTATKTTATKTAAKSTAKASTSKATKPAAKAQSSKTEKTTTKATAKATAKPVAKATTKASAKAQTTTKAAPKATTKAPTKTTTKAPAKTTAKKETTTQKSTSKVVPKTTTVSKTTKSSSTTSKAKPK
ncbi:MAG: signal peptidase I [Christensenellaceae bacterium]|nr:signal peptidase I [Christensenellaceae bacterium]